MADRMEHQPVLGATKSEQMFPSSVVSQRTETATTKRFRDAHDIEAGPRCGLADLSNQGNGFVRKSTILPIEPAGSSSSARCLSCRGIISERAKAVSPSHASRTSGGSSNAMALVMVEKHLAYGEVLETSYIEPAIVFFIWRGRNLGTNLFLRFRRFAPDYQHLGAWLAAI